MYVQVHGNAFQRLTFRSFIHVLLICYACVSSKDRYRLPLWYKPNMEREINNVLCDKIIGIF